MRNHAQTRARAEEARLATPPLPVRKVFNCIVDDTALIAGGTERTRDGLRKWINTGAIRLFVPIETLTRIGQLKNGDHRINRDAREVIRWLDNITSDPDVLANGQVKLQGAGEEYATWEEVERHMLPETLLSIDNGDIDEEELVDDMENSLNLHDDSDKTSMSSSQSLEPPTKTPSTPRSAYSSGSPGKSTATLYSASQTDGAIDMEERLARNGSGMSRRKRNTMPANHRKLFRYILWRIQQEPNADDALGSFILLTNDPSKQTLAQRFGIRVKRLEQLRDAVGREDRDYKNRLTLFQKETGIDINTLPPPSPKRPVSPKKEPLPVDHDEEDEIVFKPSPRGSQSSNNQRVFDPNDFGRGATAAGARGGRNSALPRGPRGGRYVPPVAGKVATGARADTYDPKKPIDPNSFARPRPAARSLRGGRKSLWEPT